MKIAITSTDQNTDSQLDSRFGRAKHLAIADTETGQITFADNTQNLNAAQGAGIQTAQNVVNLNVQAIITGNVGPKAFRTLTAADIEIYLCKDKVTIQQAVELYQNGKLQRAGEANVEGHWI